MDNYIAAFQEQNMLLNERDDSSFIDVDMVDFGNSDELTYSYQDDDMQVENEKLEPTFYLWELSWMLITLLWLRRT